MASTSEDQTKNLEKAIYKDMKFNINWSKPAASCSVCIQLVIPVKPWGLG